MDSIKEKIDNLVLYVNELPNHVSNKEENKISKYLWDNMFGENNSILSMFKKLYGDLQSSNPDGVGAFCAEILLPNGKLKDLCTALKSKATAISKFNKDTKFNTSLVCDLQQKAIDINKKCADVVNNNL